MKNLNVVLYFGANLVPRLSTFVLLLVLTRLLSMDDYGMFALIVVTGEILDMATGGWVRLFVLSSESKDRVPSAGRLGRALVLTVASCVLSLLGALLLEQGRVEEACRTYRADLGYDDTVSRACQHPDNVWSLHGYHECLIRLGRTAEAELIEQRLRLANARTDVSVAASCFCRLEANQGI